MALRHSFGLPARPRTLSARVIAQCPQKADKSTRIAAGVEA